MPRQYLISKVPNEHHEVVNLYMVNIFGDDPGSIEIPIANAYVDGDDPDVGTYSVGCANCSQADANSIAAFLAGLSDCDSRQTPTTGDANVWPTALSEWNLKQVVFITP